MRQIRTRWIKKGYYPYTISSLFGPNSAWWIRSVKVLLIHLVSGLVSRILNSIALWFEISFIFCLPRNNITALRKSINCNLKNRIIFREFNINDYFWLLYSFHASTRLMWCPDSALLSGIWISISSRELHDYFQLNMWNMVFIKLTFISLSLWPNSDKTYLSNINMIY